MAGVGKAFVPEKRKCPCCGKAFTMLSEEWVYKTSMRNVYCSWTCYRKQTNIRKYNNVHRRAKAEGTIR